MRIASTALMILVAASAARSVAVAQILTPPWDANYDQRLAHPVPIATVSRVGDIVAVDGSRTVDDGRGEPFVLGNAMLDLHDPVHAKVVFTMSNATEAPVLLEDIMIVETRWCSVPDQNHPLAYPSAGYRAAGRYDPTQLQPGEKVTIQIPIAPSCPVFKGVETLGVLVEVGRPAPQEWSSTPELRATTNRFSRDKPLFFFRVLDRLHAETASHQ